MSFINVSNYGTVHCNLHTHCCLVKTVMCFGVPVCLVVRVCCGILNNLSRRSVGKVTMIIWNEGFAYELCLVTHPSRTAITVAAICIFPFQVAQTKHRFGACSVLYYAAGIFFCGLLTSVFLFIDAVLRID